MEYRFSDTYLRMRKNGPRRVVIVMLLVAGIFALMLFLPSYAPPISRTLPGFIAVVVTFCAIGFFQVRQISRNVSGLDRVRFRITNEGVACSLPNAEQLLKFEGIKSISIVRSRWTGRIVRATFQTPPGQLHFVGLENFEQFAKEISSYANHPPVVERTAWLS